MAISIAMNAIVPKIAMVIQTFTSHHLQNKHNQGILMFGIQSDHNHNIEIIPRSSRLAIVSSSLKLHH